MFIPRGPLEARRKVGPSRVLADALRTRSGATGNNVATGLKCDVGVCKRISVPEGVVLHDSRG